MGKKRDGRNAVGIKAYKMSNVDLRNDLIAGVISALPTMAIAYENQDFDADAVSEFVSVHYMPSTVEGLGKTSGSVDEWRGVFQVSIFIKLNSGTFDNRQLEIADELKSVFFTHAELGAAYIESAELNQGASESGWFKRDLSINYISYQTR